MGTPQESSGALRTTAALAEQGWVELREARWEDARATFAAAVALRPAGRSFEGLSWAAWWLDDAAGTFDARAHAFRLYRQERDPASAACMAVWLAADQLDFNGAFAVAGGWLRRAHRLLDGLDAGPAHGWLAFHEGYMSLISGDTARALDLAVRAESLGRRGDIADLEMLGLALRGAVRVTCGDVAEGMACLDEAAAAALTAEPAVPISRAWTCCFLVTACEAVRDYDRAFQWCDRIAEFAERYRSRYMLGFCRAHYAAVHVWRGEWQRAEAELAAAMDDYMQSRPSFVPACRITLADLRRRQGRYADAEQLLQGLPGARSLTCASWVALARQDARRSVELARRALRSIAPEARLERTAGLEVLTRASSVQGDLTAAEGALDELKQAATGVTRTPLQAAVDLAGGVLARVSGDGERARCLLEDAVDRLERCGAPVEAAAARLELALCLKHMGRPRDAAREAATALEQLSAAGAQGDAGRARLILDSCSRSQPIQRDGVLTRREQEVLRLIAQGLTNRQIGGRLVVSEHTVHRHVANILRKLGLPSRSAAAAHAAASGFLDRSD